jgi:SAM-dependent methyltransferase
LQEAGEDEAALKAVRDFHHQLCTTRVLDPACGTGNFLYVALDLMKDIENDVVVALDDLGLADPTFAFEGETITPRQFFGLDINERAVAIADLVLWLGYIKRQIKDAGLDSVRDPVLERLNNIRHQDAILAYDGKELARDDAGAVISRWNGYTMKTHPVTGNAVPDPDARVESYIYENPRRATWPEAEFIVGNPPFIGGKDMRAELGDGYAEAAWKARPNVPGGADFVMHFWDEAAQRLSRKPTKAKPNPLRRFGFITTNSITQTFSRRVVEAALSAKSQISLIFAVPDHPWMKGAEKADVQIAMTVAVPGYQEGVIGYVKESEGLNTDTPNVMLDLFAGSVTPKLTLGANISLAEKLSSNANIAHRGMQTIGSGFIISPNKAVSLEGEDEIIFEYRNSKDIAGKPRGVKVIDLYNLSIDEVVWKFPKIYQHLLESVKPERDLNNRKSYREKWWVFGEPRSELREAQSNIQSYITTGETSKHRFFDVFPKTILPDNMLIAFALESYPYLSALSSRLHVHWMLKLGGLLGPTARGASWSYPSI